MSNTETSAATFPAVDTGITVQQLAPVPDERNLLADAEATSCCGGGCCGTAD